MNRRDLILGGAMVAAAGGAVALTPRKRLVLLDDRKLDTIIPETIGTWKNYPSNDFVMPKSPGSLADRLYSQTVSRLYMAADHLPVMLVIAYGAVQNDLLQLHRPETCYAAVGYTISRSKRGEVPLGHAAELPIRELTASSSSRTEQICYWTRIGDDLPTDGSEQRRVKLRQQMRGYLSDGVLVRLSSVAPEDPRVFAELTRFAASMIAAMKPGDRQVLIGRPLAAAAQF